MVEIKQLTPNDFKKWRDLRLESLQNHPENYLSSFEEESKRTDEEWLNLNGGIGNKTIEQALKKARAHNFFLGLDKNWYHI